MKTTSLQALLLMPFFLVAPQLSQAQVKVDSTGALSIGRNTMKNARLTIGDSNSAMAGGGSGIVVDLHLPEAKGRTCGVFSKIWGDSSIETPSIGIFGYCSQASKGRAYGVIGGVSATQKGVGVYGTAGGYGKTYGEPVDGSYAGYFAGPTYVKGTLTATEVITPSDITLKENIISIEDEEESVGSTLDNVMNMNVIKYNYKPQEITIEPEDEEIDDEESMLLGSKLQTSNRILEMSQQKHYGLSAQEIREIYPDVVRESQDGILGVNYIELVPILIRSIQELKAELDLLKGKDAEPMKARSMNIQEETTDVKDATDFPVEATLAQNTPNPFSERTTIRFTLPDNTKNAYIYVFDMSGKMHKQIPVNSSMQSIVIEGHELPAGMYIYSLVIGGKEVKTRRMILTK